MEWSFGIRIEQIRELEGTRNITSTIHLSQSKSSYQLLSERRISIHRREDTRVTCIRDHRSFSRNRHLDEFFRQIESTHVHTHFLGRNILYSHTRRRI